MIGRIYPPYLLITDYCLLFMMEEQRIVIVGGGFGGMRCALDLAASGLENTKIVLINDTPHFEYHAALYRVVTGRSPMEVCVPLRDVFAHTDVEIVEDRATAVDPHDKVVTGESGSRYRYDTLVLALGSETVYFDIPGLKTLSFGFKTIDEALALKEHLHTLFRTCNSATLDEKVCMTHIVIVGGGPSGVELAGELASYTKTLAKMHEIDPSMVTIDLVEAAPRLLPTLPKDVSIRVKEQLHRLGVNIFLNRAIVANDDEEIALQDMEMKTRTVIWTAGVKPHHLYGEVAALSYDKRGHVEVNDDMSSTGDSDIFVIGDGAVTTYPGMAQTAVGHARVAAENIVRRRHGKKPYPYEPKEPIYSIPVGPGWAATLINGMRLYGTIGWWLRRYVDLRFFWSILPPRKAIDAFRSGKSICESCSVCNPEYK